MIQKKKNKGFGFRLNNFKSVFELNKKGSLDGIWGILLSATLMLVILIFLIYIFGDSAKDVVDLRKQTLGYPETYCDDLPGLLSSESQFFYSKLINAKSNIECIRVANLYHNECKDNTCPKGEYYVYQTKDYSEKDRKFCCVFKVDDEITDET